MRSLLIILGFLFLGLSSALANSSDPYYDRPRPDESFSAFFQRITKGGHFQGIKAEQIPANFQQNFLKQIWRPTWTGNLNKVQKKIEDLGYSLWQDWYPSQKPMRLIFLKTEQWQQFQKVWDDRTCLKCRKSEDLEYLPFDRLNVSERESFAIKFVIGLHDQQGNSILDSIANSFDLDSEELFKGFHFHLLKSDEFKVEVEKLGYRGPIFFRAITAPDPQNPSARVILMNDDLMKVMSPFSSPLLQNLEYIGILSHEISHVAQDFLAERIGLDLQVQSPEAALLIEGQAEFMAEAAIRNFALTYQTPALELFNAENSVEIVYREGQEQQGSLFPYTVGLPFAAALHQTYSSSEESSKALRNNTLRAISKQMSLRELFENLERL